MNRVQEDFKLKDSKSAEPEVYLGVTLSKMSLDKGKSCWSMLPEQYVRSAVANVEEDLAKNGRRLPAKCETLFSSNYNLWLETPAELKADGVQQYQEHIGQLRWAVEIGRVDV
jgi:hypothetical protein